MSSFSDEEMKKVQKICVQTTREIMEEVRLILHPAMSKVIDEMPSVVGEGAVCAILSAIAAEIGALAISIVEVMPVQEQIEAISDATMQRYSDLKKAVNDYQEKEHLKNFVKTFVNKHKVTDDKDSKDTTSSS